MGNGVNELWDFQPALHLPEIEVNENDLEEWVKSDRDFILVDIREVYEIMQGHLTNALIIPMNQIPNRLESLPKDKDLVIYCAAGMRSFDVGHYLRQQGFEKAWYQPLQGAIGRTHVFCRLGW